MPWASSSASWSQLVARVPYTHSPRTRHARALYCECECKAQSALTCEFLRVPASTCDSICSAATCAFALSPRRLPPPAMSARTVAKGARLQRGHLGLQPGCLQLQPAVWVPMVAAWVPRVAACLPTFAASPLPPRRLACMSLSNLAAAAAVWTFCGQARDRSEMPTTDHSLLTTCSLLTTWPVHVPPLVRASSLCCGSWPLCVRACPCPCPCSWPHVHADACTRACVQAVHIYMRACACVHAST